MLMEPMSETSLESTHIGEYDITRMEQRWPQMTDEPTNGKDDTVVSKPRKGGRPTPKAVAIMPDEERERLLAISRFLADKKASARMTYEQITKSAQRRMPMLHVATVTRLMLPEYISQQSEVGYRLLSAVLEAMGSSCGEMEAALRSQDSGHDATRQERQEGELLQAFRRLPPILQTVVIRNAQQYAGLDGIGQIRDILSEPSADDG